ncbi:diacylglycerol/lipid kinase family protein [Desulfosediminicola flagellatus]|uniref:diacylglycerol/lipid kinase family protein n=1 Tax=Desulfosediminicola flagellatus TaxID=2569541 RepID=UPI00142F0957|nr:YegS/Rv2252/BmrU family lipid kinase [Desulfosediminicola flagellatus]
MQTKSKIAFIINPISGNKSNSNIPNLINTRLNHNRFNHHCFITSYAGESAQIVRKLKEQAFDYIVAVGGDGTVNEVAKELINSDVALGIIPRGSGNGLARHLGIPMDTEQAIAQLNKSSVQCIDSGKINDYLFWCTAGIGFDALIGFKFANSTKRGFFTYITESFKQFIRYKADHYTIIVNDTTHHSQAFTITFANASQYGNNAYISPTADIADGKLDTVLIKPFPWFSSIILCMRLFTRSIHKSKYVKVLRDNRVIVHKSGKGLLHFDGEPGTWSDIVTAEILPKSLKVLTA